MHEWLIEKTEHIVVLFDMCSSTEIFENLLENRVETQFLELWDELRQLLYERSSFDTLYGHLELPRMDFIPNKFTGDGWLLIFPPETDALPLLKLLHHVSQRFASR